MKDESAVTVMSLGEVVAVYKSRPQKSAAEYMAEISKISEYYGAGIIEEQEKTGNDGLFSNVPFFISTPEGIVTEDAEVVSIETVKKL